MNNIDCARETIKITSEKKYSLNGKTVDLPDVDLAAVKVIPPEDGLRLLDSDIFKQLSQ